LAERYDIRHVRMPTEAIWWNPRNIFSSRFGEKVVVRWVTEAANRAWRGRLQYPRTFYGFSSGGHVTHELVRRVAQSVTAGVSELMVHVGESNEESPGFLTGYNWKGDLAAVTSYTKKQFANEFGVQLTTHQDRRSDGVRRTA
jgi:hypothetical protein